MTTQELREAAERYRNSDYCQRDSIIYTLTHQKSGDMKALADAYLAEHPADDGEAVTFDWCIANRFREISSGGDVPVRVESLDEAVLISFDLHHASLYIAKAAKNRDTMALYLFDDPTRGQVRRLIAALKGE